MSFNENEKTLKYLNVMSELRKIYPHFRIKLKTFACRHSTTYLVIKLQKTGLHGSIRIFTDKGPDVRLLDTYCYRMGYDRFLVNNSLLSRSGEVD